jgi:2,4-dienoyl-CoA reductase-like NADH-dependent reductase (Old Yellow Enzyme family)
MCQYSAERGQANTWHLIHIGSLAFSGAAMLCIEATAVEADARITPGDLGLWSEATEAALKPVLTAVRTYSKIAVTLQLAHAGRKASSHVPWEGGRQIPVSEGGWPGGSWIMEPGGWSATRSCCSRCATPSGWPDWAPSSSRFSQEQIGRSAASARARSVAPSAAASPRWATRSSWPTHTDPRRSTGLEAETGATAVSATASSPGAAAPA